MKYWIIVMTLLNLFPGISDVAAKTFDIGKDAFLVDEQPVVLRSGELHYSRIPRDYWRHRLQMCKAMGLNTVCAYMFWNAHEPKPGEFNFSGRADVAEFCRLAQEEGLMIILRPGPYSCAEWDFGGFPYWLLKDEEMKLRTQYPAYLEACKRYIRHVGRELAPLQITRGGPIIMLQVENEYGSYGSDKEYLGVLRDYWQQAGFEVPFFMCDGPVQLTNDMRQDIFSVVNFGGDPKGAFKSLRAIQNSGPLMCGEFYPAWFDHWGTEHHTKKAKKILPDIKYMLDNKASFSLYMVHGGTSFGFTAGANYSDRFQPQTTSYDYDAPISEAGWETAKYRKLRALFLKYLNPGENVADVPPQNPVIAVPEIRFKQSAPLFENFAASVVSRQPQPFEMYDQNQGCVLYKTVIPAGEAGTIHFYMLNDYARIYINDRLVETFDRRAHKGRWVTGFNERGQNIIKDVRKDEYCLSIPVEKSESDVELKVFVEAMGHINYGAVIDMDRKGIIGKVVFKSKEEIKELIDWTAFLFPLTQEHLSAIEFSSKRSNLPAFYRAGFMVDKTGDTFLDMSDWGKGVVWVNGHNLGRYWNIGPAQTLYLPGPWLKTGENEITVLELLSTEKATIKGLTKPILDQVRN